ncbi:hypothetical protein CBL_13446 [Carabus blaptoides fortunei]
MFCFVPAKARKVSNRIFDRIVVYVTFFFTFIVKEEALVCNISNKFTSSSSSAFLKILHDNGATEYRRPKLRKQSSQQSLESGREKHIALEKKVTSLEAEKDQALLKIESQESTITDLQRDVSKYKTEYLKSKLQLKTLENAMSEIISPALQAAIATKVEEAVKKNLPEELQASLPLELQTNMTLDLDSSNMGGTKLDSYVEHLEDLFPNRRHT